MEKFKEEFELIERINLLRKKMNMLRQSYMRGGRFDFCTWDHDASNAVVRQFKALLDEFEFFSEKYRWDTHEEAYWFPEVVLQREPTFDEAMKCFRFIHRCERIMWGSPWYDALSMGLVDWGLRGLIERPAERVRMISRCVSFV